MQLANAKTVPYSLATVANVPISVSALTAPTPALHLFQLRIAACSAGSYFPTAYSVQNPHALYAAALEYLSMVFVDVL